jgi:type I restriction enzyme S subunit
VASEVDNIIDGLPSHWERTTLGTICERGGGLVQTGPFGSQLHAADYVAVGIPSIMPVNIENFRVTEQGIERVAPADAERLSRHLVRPGDIVFSRRGDVERHALIRESERGWMCGTGCVLVRMGDKWKHDETPVLPEFASYWLRHPDVRGWIVAHAVGSTMPNLNTSIMAAIPFVVPPLPEQRSISRVLGGLDDKIELNRRMNRTLEDLARGLFRSWFVDFDPVTKPSRGFAGNGHGRAPATPAGLFPKRLVDSPIGPIPEGWRVGTLGDIGTNPRRGVLPSEVDSATPYIGLEHMPRRCIALDDWGTAADVSSGKSRFARGEILFGKLRPYFHKVGVALIDGVCSTDVIVAAPKKECWFGVLLGHLSSDEFIDYVDGASGGTRMPRTSWGDMARYQIAIPPEPIAASFAVWLRRVSELMREHAHESRTLAALRDALLPQLLSGEIRLREAEAAVGETFRSGGTPRRGDGSTHPRTGKAAGTAKGRL